MFPGVHDSSIVAYSVDARSQELSLVLEPGSGSATSDFHLVFRGVAAHQFKYPQLPSVVGGLTEVPVADLLRREAENLAKGTQQCGWPGAWFTSLEEAVTYCEGSGLKAYELDQSYGMSGWVIARSVERVGGP